MKKKINSHSLKFHAFKMAIATFLSRILGLVREQVLAILFGASGISDAFLVAYRIPNLLRDLFAEGSFSLAFVPVFIEARQKDPSKAKELFWSLTFILSLVTGVLGAIFFFGAPWIVEVMTSSEFTSDTEKMGLTIKLTQTMAPFLWCVSMAALCMGALNSLKIFFIPALAPALFNLTMIITVLCLYKKLTPPIWAMGFGVLFGGFAQLLFQVPFVLKRGITPSVPQKIWSPFTKKVFRLLSPSLIGSAATQINLLLTTIMATSIIGGVSWLNYAFRLFQFPVGVLGVSLAGATLVHFSEKWKAGKKDEAAATLRETLASSYFLMFFCSGITFILAEDIVRLIFQHGTRFTSEDTLQTALALKFYSLSLPAYGVCKILLPIFYAQEKHKISLLGPLSSIAMNLIVGLSLLSRLGHLALAISMTSGTFLNAIILGLLSQRNLSPSKNHSLKIRFHFTRAFFVFLLSAFLASSITFFFKNKILLPHENLSERFFGVVLYSAFSFTLYLIFIFLFGEKRVFLSLLEKLRRRKKL